jgi:hypothetical protein
LYKSEAILLLLTKGLLQQLCHHFGNTSMPCGAAENPAFFVKCAATAQSLAFDLGRYVADQSTKRTNFVQMQVER